MPAEIKELKKSKSERIVVRKPELDYSKVPKVFFQDSQTLSSLVAALSVIFPEGERLFIRSVRAFADQVSDEQLKTEIKAFIGQEASHGTLHERFNKRLIELGYDLEAFEEQYVNFCYGFVEKELTAIFGMELALSVTTALEHYTATLAKTVFDQPDLFDRTNPEVYKLLHWHASEEIEHKLVTWDLLKVVNEGYGLRMAGFALGTAFLFGAMVYGTAFLLLKEKNFNWVGGLLDYLKVFNGWDSFGVRSARAVLDYLRPSFDPREVDDLAVARAKLKEIGMAS